MKFSRRSFIKTGGSSLVGLGIILSGTMIDPAQSLFNRPAESVDSLFAMNFDSFNNLIGRNFTFYTENAAYQGTLSEVLGFETKTAKSSLRQKQDLKPPTSFSLKFEVSTANLPQATYKVYEQSLGQFDLLLVPGKTAADQSVLFATFNRL